MKGEAQLTLSRGLRTPIMARSTACNWGYMYLLRRGSRRLSRSWVSKRRQSGSVQGFPLLADKFRAAMASIWRRLVILASSMFLRFGVDIESVGWLVGVSDARLQTGPGRNPVFFPNREKEIKRT